MQDWIAESRIEIDMAREYVLRTAHLMDTVGNKSAATEISGIKVAVPNMALRVIDRAIQVHGAAGVSQYTKLAEMYAHMRTLRIADGPDEVHKMTIARREILKHDPSFRMNPALGSATRAASAMARLLRSLRSLHLVAGASPRTHASGGRGVLGVVLGEQPHLVVPLREHEEHEGRADAGWRRCPRRRPSRRRRGTRSRPRR